ncbi:MAG: hypothetical protein ACK53Y_11365, partial [bacterium]
YGMITLIAFWPITSPKNPKILLAQGVVLPSRAGVYFDSKWSRHTLGRPVLGNDTQHKNFIGTLGFPNAMSIKPLGVWGVAAIASKCSITSVYLVRNGSLPASW